MSRIFKILSAAICVIVATHIWQASAQSPQFQNRVIKPNQQLLTPNQRGGVRLPPGTAQRLQQKFNMFGKRGRLSNDKRTFLVPLTPAEARQRRIAPPMNPPRCQAQTPQQKAATDQRWANRQNELYRQCLSQVTRGGGDIPSRQTDEGCRRSAEYQARNERNRAVRTASDNDGDGELSWCMGGRDCDDSDRNRFSGAPEVPDAAHKDEDCNPRTFGSVDRDRDGYFDARHCNWDGRNMICGGDCNDNRANINPRTPEVCDGIDNDCDGDVDENVSRVLYLDSDGDRFGDPHTSMLRCNPGPDPQGRGVWVADNRDCNDRNPTVKPGAGC